MRNGLIVCVLTLVFGSVAFGQGGTQAADSYLGTWAGTWVAAGDEPASGTIEITLEKTGDAAPTGKVKATTSESSYTAVFKTLVVDGNKMRGTYDHPLGEGGEVTVESTFDGTAAKGTWKLNQPGQATELARGTWTAAKK